MLRTVDIGEADRFCLFLSRERGRLSAKARSVRKTASRMGGSLLPFRHLSVELVESEHHATVVSVTDRSDLAPPVDFTQLITVERGVELLLALTEEGEPLPEVFDLLLAFLRLSADASRHLLFVFQLRLLHLLGLLPAHSDDSRVARLPAAVTSFLTLCTRTDDLQMLAHVAPSDVSLDSFLRSIIEGHLSHPLRSEGMGVINPTILPPPQVHR